MSKKKSNTVADAQVASQPIPPQFAPGLVVGPQYAPPTGQLPPAPMSHTLGGLPVVPQSAPVGQQYAPPTAPPVAPVGQQVVIGPITPPPTATAIPSYFTVDAGGKLQVSDEVLEQLISEAEIEEEESDIVVRHCRGTKPLLEALRTRNRKNRYLKDSRWKKYATQMVTNLNDENGNPVVDAATGLAVTEWDWSLPIIVYMDGAEVTGTSYRGNSHNAQHCIEAALNARDWIPDDKVDVDQQIQGAKNYEKNGVTVELIDQLQLIIVQGINEGAADFIDTADRRTTGDVAFRNREDIFAGLDYKSLLKDNETEIKNFDAKQNQEAGYVSTVLKIVSWRKWYRGEFIRGGSMGGKKFEAAAFKAAYFEFPDAIRSVHEVWLQMQKKTWAEQRKATHIPVPYLMAAHYLAAMAFATKNPQTGQWSVSQQAFDYASQFIDAVVLGIGNPLDHSINKLRSVWLADPQINGAMEPNDPARQAFFSHDNIGLKAIFNSLGAAFQSYFFGVVLDAGLIGQLRSGVPFMRYAQDANDQNAFDIRLEDIRQPEIARSAPAPVVSSAPAPSAPALPIAPAPFQPMQAMPVAPSMPIAPQRVSVG